MHLLHRSVVSVTLRLRDHPVDFHDILTDSLLNVHAGYNRLDIAQISVDVMVMAMIMFVMVVMVMLMVVFMIMVMVMVIIMVVFMIMVMLMFVVMIVVMVVLIMFMMVVMVVVVIVYAVMVFDMFVMMVPVYVEALFLLAVDRHLQMTAPDPALIHGFQSICDTRNTKRIQFLQHMFRLRMKFQKGSRKHVARRAHIAFEI